jgi:hypothetical protein
MERSAVVVKVTYNGMRCKDLYYIPGEVVEVIENEIVYHHLLTDFKILSDRKGELLGTDRLALGTAYEIVCGCGKFHLK